MVQDFLAGAFLGSALAKNGLDVPCFLHFNLPHLVVEFLQLRLEFVEFFVLLGQLSGSG